MTPEEQAAADAAAAQAQADADAAGTDDALKAALARIEALESKTNVGERAQIMARVLGDGIKHPNAQFFAEKYDGEITVDAVTAAATTLRLIGEAPDPLAQAGFTAALDLRAGAMSPESQPGPHPNELARENALAARKVGTEADALGAYVEGHSRAIGAGDRRSMIDPRAPRHLEPRGYDGPAWSAQA